MATRSPESEQVRSALADLQGEIRRHRAALEEAGCLDPADPLAQVRLRAQVNAQFPIGWPVMPKGLVPKAIAVAKKLARRLLRWYIDPLVDQQNEYNAVVVRYLETMQGRDEERAARLDRLEYQVNALARRLDVLEGRVAEREG